MTDEKGAKLPQFMSTHPSDASRLKELQAFLPEARKYYVPAPEAQSLPRRQAPAPRRPGSGFRRGSDVFQREVGARGGKPLLRKSVQGSRFKVKGMDNRNFS